MPDELWNPGQKTEDEIGLRGKRVQGRVALIASSPAAELFPIRSSKNLDRFVNLEL
jgi:hypothetical protein